MPNNSGKKMGMMQLGLLTVGALLLSGALIVKTKRDAVADVPAATAQQIAQETPAAGDSDMPQRTFGGHGTGPAADVGSEPAASAGHEGGFGHGGRAAPEGTAAAEPGVSAGSEGGHGDGGHAAPGDAATADVPGVATADCSAYEGWVGKPLDRAAIEATGKVHRILKPGDMMTMDFNAERINVETDEKGEMVTRVFCG